MDPMYCLQDLVRCHLCETEVPIMHCDICQKNLCKACVGEHLLDESIEHKIVPFKKRGSTSKCPKHSSKVCELYCEQCNIPICATCATSQEHCSHKLIVILKQIDRKKKIIQRDLQELENSICQKYLKIASGVPIQKADLKEHSIKLKTVLNKHGENWHRTIDTIIGKMKSDLDEIELKNTNLLNQQEFEIKCTISQITASILDLKKLLISDDISRVSAYKSKNDEFKKTVSQAQSLLTKFCPSQDKQKTYLSRVWFVVSFVYQNR